MNKHVIFSGRVQGVGFRFSARNEAINMGVHGWVRNLPDGTVELEAEGKKEIVDAYIKKLKSGLHSGILVDHVEEKEQPDSNAYKDFSIR
ncbi:MAG TPA: acylphosphatase [Bacillota bacterium]|nr:acylphosphatase [Bacillota bacterium]